VSSEASGPRSRRWSPLLFGGLLALLITLPVVGYAAGAPARDARLRHNEIQLDAGNISSVVGVELYNGKIDKGFREAEALKPQLLSYHESPRPTFSVKAVNKGRDYVVTGFDPKDGYRYVIDTRK
jgi:hypothetical protein